MARFRRVLVAVAVGLIAPIIPSSIYAGGGVGGGGGVVISVDHGSPAGHNFSFRDFFSRVTTVHQGDTVTWQWAPTTPEAHTVTLLPAGTPYSSNAVNRLFPGAGSAAPDKDDGPRGGLYLPFNAALHAGCGSSPYFPNTVPCSYDGRAPLNSGFLWPGKIPAQRSVGYSVRFNVAPGAYHYFCLLHDGMEGTIRVVKPGQSADSQTSINQRALVQYQAAATHALAHAATVHAIARPGANGHTQWIVRSGDQYGRVLFDEFLPATLHTKLGDTVAWTPGFHTVTFPKESGVAPFLPTCESAGQDHPYRGTVLGCDVELNLNLKAFLPSQPPGKPYSGGFANSGNLVIPSPHFWSTSFSKAGTYHYDCLIHPGMDAVIQTG